jgi:integron integrase
MTDKDLQKLLDQVRYVLRRNNYAFRTEETYLNWIKRFIRFHNLQHPTKLDTPHIEAFLTDLALVKNVAASTQNQAFNAVMFLYHHVIRTELSSPVDAIRARHPKRLPTVLTKQETNEILAALSGTHQLMARLLYGGGLRLMECVRLRVKDVDFSRRQIMVRNGKGYQDRVTMLPDTLIEPLQQHLPRVKQTHLQDLKLGYGRVHLPYALVRKYPGANREWAWQYVFPARHLAKDPRANTIRRHHLAESGLQKAVRRASRQVGLLKHVTCHTFRHSFATHLLEAGYDIRTVQELLGHKDVRTTMIYTHVLNKGPMAVRSPLDL